MNELTGNLNRFWAELVVEELCRREVFTFCLASGSRCSPLTHAVARHASARSVIHVDERGLGYYAVGHARATGRPVAIVTTSGTATGNLLPAVIEASQSRLPLVILSADRPPELHDVDANQTMCQSGLFGSWVRFDAEMPCPDGNVPPEYVLSTVDHAVQSSLFPHPGPVHLNLMYREPLVSDSMQGQWSLSNVHPWFESAAPHTGQRSPEVQVAEEDLDEAARTICESSRGMIFAGELCSPSDGTNVLNLARHLGWPVVADVLSGLRCINDPLVAGAGVLRVAGDRFSEVDVVLHVGGRFVSKDPLRFFTSHPPRAYLHATPFSARTDPQHLVTQRLQGSIIRTMRQLTNRASVSAASSLAEAVSASWSGIQSLLTAEEERSAISEPMIARAVSRELPEGHGLFLGNSMPVRDLDFFAAARGDRPLFGANRGVSGIDGTISSGFGFSGGSGGPATLLLGDLACLHDLNGLKLAAQADYPVTIVVLNNNGGGIFHFLPVALNVEVFESHYGTPHGLQFRDAAGMFGLPYAKPETMASFLDDYRSSIQSGTTCLIEVSSDREENRIHHLDLVNKIERDLS